MRIFHGGGTDSGSGDPILRPSAPLGKKKISFYLDFSAGIGFAGPTIMKPHSILTAALAALLGNLAAQAGDSKQPSVTVPPEKSWLDSFKPTLNARLRYEYADFDDKDESNAATARARLGLLAGPFAGFSAFGEFEGTWTPDREAYNAQVHGDPARTPVVDPESHELNQLWGRYEYEKLFSIKAGRQEINLDNQRYVGTVGWRQNEQTFDAAALVVTPTEGLELEYAYLWQVNRIFGSEAMAGPYEDFEGDTHLAHLSYSKLPIGKLTAYAYWMDLANTAGSAASNASYGLSLAGATPISDGLKLAHYLEAGYQTDYADNPKDYGAWYAHARVGLETKDWTVGLGCEHLGSDSGVGYQFPLGTNHKFDGYADRFLATPAGGLEDLYVSGTVNLPAEFKGELALHVFGDDSGSFDYGKEIDVVLSRPIGEHVTAMLKYAFYAADDFASDTHRVTLDVNVSF